MRRAWVGVGLLLAACGSSGAAKPDHAEKVRRAQMVGPALLDLTPDTSIIDEVSCSFDDDDNVRGYLAAQLKTSAGTSDKAARQAIAIDLITCPESRWDDLAGAWAAAGIADRSTLAAIVDDGVAAIRR